MITDADLRQLEDIVTALSDELRTHTILDCDHPLLVAFDDCQLWLMDYANGQATYYALWKAMQSGLDALEAQS